MPTSNQAEPLRNAIRLFNENRIENAVRAFEIIVNVEPRNAVAFHFLGLCKHRQGQSQAAGPLLLKSIELDPTRATFHSNLGLFLAELNELDRAIEAYAEALRLDPNSAQTLTNLGNVHQRKGRNREAIECFQAALRIEPEFSQALNNLGGAFAREGRTPEAMRVFEKALRVDSSIPEIHLNLGNLYFGENQFDAALARYQTALRLRSDYPEALTGLARVANAKGDPAAAVEHLRQALKRQPTNAKACLELGNILREGGRIDEALAFYEKAAALDPANFYAHWNACLAMPILYRSPEEIGRHRNRWQAGVQRLRSAMEVRSPACQMMPSVAPHTNFYLHYQGFNDRAEQAEFARIISRLASQAYPELSRPIPRRPARGPRKVKVGFLSCFFNLHTVFKLFHGWIRNLNRDSFETFAFHLGKETDKASDFVRDHAEQFYARFRSPDEIIQRVRACDLDVLIYPEIGMDPVTLSLAALRLAPVQCMSWGHPVTSGLATIDYFLSSELMETAEADGHYSETLVRLPNLSICYPAPDLSIAREPEGLSPPDPNKIRFLCLQSLFKLLPQYDDLYPRIARQVPQSEFRFIALDSRELTEMFRQRLAGAFERHGLDLAKHVRLFPKMKIGSFFGLVRDSHIILDSVGWSGGNTTLEAIGFDKPVVTLPGEMMRSRHSFAILTRLGVDETIAGNHEEYVNIAVRLASDHAWHSQMVNRIAANKARVYQDFDAVRGLERFLLNVVAAKPAQG